MAGFMILLLFLVSFVRPGASEEVKEEGIFIYNDHERRDPFWPLVSSEGGIVSYETDLQITDLNLEGIITGAGGKNLAVINGRIVKRNDSIGKFTVTEIKSAAVVLLKGQERYELKLKKED